MTKKRMYPRPSDWCLYCKERREYDKYFRKHFGHIHNFACQFYLMAIPNMEWRTRAKPGDWIVASYRSWAALSFFAEPTIRRLMRRLALEGVIEYIPGRCYGLDNATRIRRCTIEEMNSVVSRREVKVNNEEFDLNSYRNHYKIYGKIEVNRDGAKELAEEERSYPVQGVEEGGSLAKRLISILEKK